jgi:hypothetical protein
MRAHEFLFTESKIDNSKLNKNNNKGMATIAIKEMRVIDI